MLKYTLLTKSAKYDIMLLVITYVPSHNKGDIYE